VQPATRAVGYDDQVRVLYLTDRLSVHGGAGHHLLDVIAAVDGAGHETTIAAGRVERGVPEAFARRTTILRGLARPTAAPTRLDGLAELAENVDVVHVQNVMNPIAIRQAVSTGRAVVTVQDHRVLCPGPGRTLPDGRRCTATMHVEVCAACLRDASYRERMVRLTAERRDALVGARLVVLSRYMADELASAGLAEATVIPPWVEADPDPSHPGGGFLLGGRLVAHKAPLQAWAAWRAAGEPLPLRVAGTGPAAEVLHDAELLGWLDCAQLRSELRRARALLFPTRWQEPFGILGVEAQAMGTPVVVVDRGGTPDWSEAGCVHVPAGDVPAMAEAIRCLAGDPELARRLGREGWSRVRERYARASLLGELLAVYESARRRPRC
jgi:glycosyltransferase involved in cell wall biosynthesis